MGQIGAVFPGGGGGVGELIRVKDWSETPLGPRDRWSQPLHTSVSICLASRFPMFLWWGHELINIYNDAYIPLMGAKHPDGLGRPAPELWAEVWPILEPLAMDVVERGRASWSEAQLLHLERSGYPEECYFDFAYSPVMDGAGGVGGLLGVVSEITERVLSGRRLQTLSEIAARVRGIDHVSDVQREAVAALNADQLDLPFALLYEHVGDGARLVAATGLGPREQRRLAGGQGARLEGRAAALRQRVDGALARREQSVIVELPALELTTDGERPGADKALILPVDDTGEGSATLALVCGLSRHRPLDDDLRRFCELVATAIGGAVGDARALEEERARAESLAELDRAKTEFFSNVSHEFRTPLTLLLGPLEDAVNRSDPDPALVMAHRNALRLLKHVNTLLEFSRLQAERVQADPRPIDLGTFSTELASMFRSAVEKAELTLTLDCGQAPVTVVADADQLEQIILNLLSNALKFTREGGITVRVYESAGRGVVEVSDTGIGIPESDLDRLFERFHRVEEAWSRSHEGSGIGLALVKELAVLQGGTVTLESHEGSGTTFSVSLPLSTEAEGDGAPAASTRAEAFLAEALRWSDGTEPVPTGASAESIDGAEVPAEDRARVLIVDDSADMRDYLGRLLGARYEVRMAADGEQALELLLAGAGADLVLSDVMMPRLDGFGLVRRIRAIESLAGTPVILLSARAGEEASVEGLVTGADDYVVKPFSARELVARVAANLELGALRNREARRSAEYAERLRGLLERERAVAETLQRSMLPEHLDMGVFTRVGARYEPAQAAMKVGGDFYDALALPDGRVLLVVGDVAGHGLESAVVMGTMRAALRAYVLRDPSPDRLLEELNAFAYTLERPAMVTCQCVLIDAEGRGLTYATAGHPPGLIRSADGRVALLQEPGAPPLGAQLLPRFPLTRVPLEAGDTIALYTDGLVERRGEAIDAGIARLVAAVAGQRNRDAAGPAALAEELVLAQRPDGGYEDDVAVLVASLEAPGTTLELELPASLDVLPGLRRTLQRWLAAQDVSAEEAYDIVFASHEAAANIVEHAYGLKDGQIELRCRADDDAVHVTLADRGRWRPPRGEGRGRGVGLMREVMDEVEIERLDDGSTVHLLRRRSRGSA